MHLERAPIVQAFHIIRQQTPYRVIYDNSLVKAARPVTVSVENEKLPVVLNLLFRGQPFEYRVIDKSIIITPRKPVRQSAPEPASPVVADTIVTGKVVADSTLLPLAGATITVRETNTSIATDNEGRFRLTLSAAGATLVISYVGYESQTIRVNERSGFQIRVVLAKTQQEMKGVTVVSTGYQEIPKERATGSFTQIDNKLFNEQVGLNVLDRLPAIANGLSLDRRTSKPGLMIRGVSTIQGPAGPLIILDNFPFEGDINSINPNDVESITILKDAAAASIWGTKAGNGVIVITTKKGKFNQPFSIEFNANTTLIEKPNLFYAKQISTSDFIDVEEFLFKQQYKFSDTANPGRPAFSPVYEILFRQRSGIINENEARSQINELRGLDVRNEFNKYMYQDAINQQYSINLQGGSDKMSWISSMGYDRNIGNLDESLNRLNFRIENVYKPTKRLSIQIGGYYNQSESSSGKSAYGSISTSTGEIPPYTQFTDVDGSAKPIYNLRSLYLDTAGNGKLLDWKYYPLEEYKHVKNTIQTQNMIGKLGINYNLFQGKNFEVLYQYERQQSSIKTLYDENSYYTRDLINRFSQIDGINDRVIYKVPKGSILDLSGELLQSHNLRGQINFNKDWLKNNIVAIAGWQIRNITSLRNGYRTYGFDEDILTSDNVDYTNPYPDYVRGYLAYIPGSNSFSETNNRFVSFYGNAAYTYDEKYTVSLSGRRDASNLFGAKTNDKWTPLWSAGASWNIHRERFYNNEMFTYLRMRLSYGYSGNADPGKSAVTVFHYFDNSPYTRSPIARILSFGNPELKWEKVGMLNIGIDFKTRNNWINGSIEFYSKNGKDLFGTDLIDYTGGVGASIVKNVASMQGSGFDIELHSLNIDRSFKWETDLNLNTNKDKIVEYYLTTTQGSNLLRNIPSGLKGKPVFSVFSYKWGGLDPLNGDPQGYFNGSLSKDYNSLTGRATQIEDMVYNGPALPTLFGSMGNTFSYKKVSINFRLTYKFGHYFRRESIKYFNLFSGSMSHSDYSARWQNPGDEMRTTVPSMIYPAITNRDNFYTGSEVLVSKADHIRFQYISLNYTLDSKLKGNWGFKRIQIYCVINNIGILWRANKYGIDPDYPDATIPPSKSISLGVKATL
jgi:TonB-linked SusC/RagA family outer membrane protein